MPISLPVVKTNPQDINYIGTNLTTPLDTATAYLAHLLLLEKQSNAHAKVKEPTSHLFLIKFVRQFKIK